MLCAALLLAFIPPTLSAQEATQAPSGDASTELGTSLPAADLPTMNEQGYVFEIESTFSGSLDSIPAEAPVYNMLASSYSIDQANQISTQLGIGADVTDNGGGSYSAQGQGSLFITPGLVQFVSNATVEEGALPGDTEAIAFAREWLRGSSLLPPDIGEGRIQAKVASPPRVIVAFGPAQPGNLLSSIPGITVTIGPNGAVLEAAIRWATITQGEVYALTPAENAWADVEGRRSYLNVQLPVDQFPAGTVVRGTAEFTTATVQYASSGIPGEQQYLQPVIVFNGRFTPEGQSATYAVTAYVPGLINSNQPVG
jgi:hypothetical protein